MPVNDKIRVPDYNDIRNSVATVLSTGSATTGWGMPLYSSEVSEGNRVSVNEWGNLRFDIINGYKRIFGTTTPTIVSPQEGNTIRYDTDFAPSSNMALEAPVTQYSSHAAILLANRFTVHPSQSATQSAGSNSTTWPGIYGSSWNSRLQATVTVTWSSATAARYFFNSGGEIRFTSSRSGGSSTSQNTTWTSILSSAGTITFGAVIPDSGTSPLNGRNFYRCTNSYQEWYTISGSSPYGSNSYKIYARTPDVANNSSGTASRVQFLLEYNDNYFDPGPNVPENPPPGDAVDGTFSISVSYLYATQTLEPPGRGTYTVEQPSITIGAPAPA